MDHYNDPVLVWCDFHGGSDMVPWSRMRQPCLEWMRTDRTSEFTHFNFVIRLSIVKQLAFPFSTILRDPAAPVIPLNVPISSSVAQERLTKKSKLAFYDRECAWSHEIVSFGTLRLQACPLPAGMGFLVLGEVKNIVHLL